jgi:3-phenylpropionate/trans-cinnamate dioxygenase ferredoxin subunit
MDSSDERNTPGSYIVGNVEEFELNQIRTKEINHRHIGVVQVTEGVFRAFTNRCPHEGAPLSEGRVEKKWLSNVPGIYETESDVNVVVCPWHNFEFMLDSGLSVCDPARMRVRTYDVGVIDNCVYVYM